jgi:putative MATE family efflux protein
MELSLYTKTIPCKLRQSLDSIPRPNHTEQNTREEQRNAMTAHANDLTRGSILKKILLVAIPIMGTQLLQMTYNLTDMFWLGRMEHSVTAVAASGLAGMFLWLGMALMIFGRTGAEIGVSQNLGRGDREEALGFAQEATRIALVLGLFYGLVLISLAGPLISLLQVNEADVFKSACDYLRIAAIGIPFSYVSAAITGSFNGAGNSRLGFWANASGLVINMILDPLMILGWGWGIQGAAIATVIAEAIVCLLLVFFAKRHPKRPFERFQVFGRFCKSRIRQILAWSVPVSLESAAFTMLAMVVTGMVSSGFGAQAVAVQRVGSQVESLSWLIGGGFSSAVATFMGQNYGARKWARIRRGFRISLTAMLIWMAIVTLILIFAGRFLFSLFLREPPELLDMGADYLMILAGCQLFMALEGTSAGTFRGMGKTLPPSISSITANLIRPALCWTLAQKIGLNGFWLGITLSAALRGTMMFVWFILYQRRLPHEDEKLAMA